MQAALSNTATADYFAGKLPLAKTEFLDALALVRELGEKQAISYKLTFLGRIALSEGDLPAAHRYLDDSVAALQAIGETVTEPVIWQGELAIAEGHPETAEVPLMALAMKYEKPGPGLKAWIVLAKSRLARGDLDKARQAADRAIALSAKSPNRADYGLPADLIGSRVAIAEGHYPKAGSDLRTLLAEARKLQNVPHEFSARFALAELATRTGSQAAALATTRDLQRDAARVGFGSISLAAGQLAETVTGHPLTRASR